LALLAFRMASGAFALLEIEPLRTAMTVAGSDSGAGAGIQADLKTFAALGVYGTSVITAITAQNTQGVLGVETVSPALVAAQVDAVVGDIGADAVKTGMLADAAIVEVIAAKLREYRLGNVVVDPVLEAKGGVALLSPDGLAALREELLPQAFVITPNVAEASALVGRRLGDWDDLRQAAREIAEMGAKNVVIKGGHLEGPATDLLFDGRQFHELAAPRVASANTHGIGCTFAAAIAAALAKGSSVRQAVATAKAYVTKALQMSYPVGRGQGPVHHFFRYWQDIRH
jgi:hydroxymethylpyrimidine/phosphomethylpyrimidine kinase